MYKINSISVKINANTIKMIIIRNFFSSLLLLHKKVEGIWKRYMMLHKCKTIIIIILQFTCAKNTLIWKVNTAACKICINVLFDKQIFLFYFLTRKKQCVYSLTLICHRPYHSNMVLEFWLYDLQAKCFIFFSNFFKTCLKNILFQEKENCNFFVRYVLHCLKNATISMISTKIAYSSRNI